MENKLKTLCRL